MNKTILFIFLAAGMVNGQTAMINTGARYATCLLYGPEREKTFSRN